MKNIMLFLSILYITVSCSGRHGAALATPENGFYEVKRFDSLPLLHSPAPPEFVLELDTLFNKADRRTIVVDTTEFVPLQLAGKPNIERQSDLKKLLSITLSQVAYEKMKTFSAKRVMKQVAIVIGGKVITVHKIREAITGPGVQITRCDDNACDYLLLKMKE